MALVRMKPPVGVSVGLGADDKLYYIDGQGFANVDSGSVTKLTAEGWVSAVPVAPEAPGNTFPVSASKTLTGGIDLLIGTQSVIKASPQVLQNGSLVDLPAVTFTVTQTASAPSVTASSGQITSQPLGSTVKITGSASADGQYVRATGALPASFKSRGMEVSVPVFIPDHTKIQSLTMSFSSDGYSAKQLYCQYTPEFSGLHFIGLNDRVVQGVAGGQVYQAIGGEVSDGTSFTHARIQLTLLNGATGVSAYFGKPIVGARKRARIMLTVDDGEDLILKRLDSTKPFSALQYLQATGLPMTHFLISSLINTAGYVTTSDVQRILAAGHQICPHGAASMASLADDATRRADIQANIDGLVALGVSESMLLDCYAYPNGIFEATAGDQTVMQILRDKGFKLARTALRRAFIPIDAGIHRQYHMPILGHYSDVGGGGETLAQSLQHIDDLAASGGLGVFTFHKFTLGAAVTNLDMQLSSFFSICDRIRSYINAGAMVAVTPADLVREFALAVPASNTP